MTAADASQGTAGGLPPVSSLADEAAQLLDALAARLVQVRATLAEPGDGRPPGDDGFHQVGAAPTGPGHDRPEAAGHQLCVGWCPVCRTAELLRGDRPEVAGKLVDSAMIVVGALRSLLPETPVGSEGAAAAGAGSATEQPGNPPPAPAPAPPGIERIDIR